MGTRGDWELGESGNEGRVGTRGDWELGETGNKAINNSTWYRGNG